LPLRYAPLLPFPCVIRLGDFLPPDGHGLVTTIQKVVPNLRPMSSQVARKLIDGHTVHSRSPFVGPDAFQRPLHVVPLKDRLHEPDFSCRASGKTRRYEHLPFTSFTADFRFAPVSPSRYRSARAGHRSGLCRGESSAVFQRLVSPTATMPSADSRHAVDHPCGQLSPFPDARRASRGKPGDVDVPSGHCRLPLRSSQPVSRCSAPRTSVKCTDPYHVMDRGLRLVLQTRPGTRSA